MLFCFIMLLTYSFTIILFCYFTILFHGRGNESLKSGAEMSKGPFPSKLLRKEKKIKEHTT